MKNIMIIQDLIESCPLVGKKRKNIVVFVSFIIIGLAILAYSFGMKEANVSSALLFVGCLLSFIGIIGLVFPQYKVIYKKTGETLESKKMYFSEMNKSEVEMCLEEGNYEKLECMTTLRETPIMVYYYGTHSGSLTIGQMQTFIPYCYEPQTEAFVLEKDVKKMVKTDKFSSFHNKAAVL